MSRALPRRPALHAFIDSHREAILVEWEDFARSLPPGESLDVEALRDHAKDMLVALAEDMRRQQSDGDREAKGKGRLDLARSALSIAARSHATGRVHERFDLNQLVAEFRAIRASVLRQWSRCGDASSTGIEDEIMRFNEAIDQAIAASVLEHTRQIDETRHVLLGMLAHDLRGPLQVVQVSAQTLLRIGGQSEHAQRSAGRILTASQQMGRLVQNLITYAMAQLAGQPQVQRTEVDLAALGAACVDQCRGSHPGRTVSLQVGGNEALGAWDPDQIQQMLMNLVLNAFNHGDAAGAVSVTVHGRNDDVVLSVHNQGPPIPPSAREDLFRPLHERRSSESIRQATGSSGLHLGLYISRQIAQAHGGDIEVASDIMNGTTFSVTLPRHAPWPQDEPAGTMQAA